MTGERSDAPPGPPVPAPGASRATPGPRLRSRAHPLRLPLLPAGGANWIPYYLFHGTTRFLRGLSCHVSVLKGGHSPHPPHAHDEEEILLLLSGAADLTLPAVGRPVRLTPGQLVYYPAFFAHTLQAAGGDSAVYLMLKWRSFARQGDSALSFGRFSAQGAVSSPGTGRGIHTELVFQGPTVYLRKLHCHTTTLPPGAGYAPHADEYDVAIVMLKGEVETLGERVGPHGVVFCAAGEPHGMRNPGEATAEYLVFELHGRRSLLTRPFLAPLFTLLEKVADPRRWKRKLKSLFSRQPA